MICLESFSQKPLWCLEVKWSDRVVANHDEINGLLKFLTIHGSQMRDEPTVTTKTIRHHFPVQGFPIKFVPSAELVYTIGKNNLGGVSIRYGAKDE